MQRGNSYSLFEDTTIAEISLQLDTPEKHSGKESFDILPKTVKFFKNIINKKIKIKNVFHERLNATVLPNSST